MKHLLSIMFVIVVISSVAFSQNFGKTGTIEFGGQAAFMSTTPVVEGETGDATTVIMFQPSFGYFVMDGLEVGVNPLSITSMSQNSNTLTNIGFWAFGAYHFTDMGSTYPYLQALLGYTSVSDGDNTASGLSYGVGAGAKFEIAGGLLLDANLNYRFYTYNPDGADKRWGNNVLTIGVGLSGFLNY